MPRHYGIPARFADAAALYHGCEKIRDAGYSRWDSHTPFPVHGLEREVNVRLAEGPDGAFYLDLGDESWSAVRVAPEGWGIVTEPPVRFRRPRGLRPLRTPSRGGTGWAALRATRVESVLPPRMVPP